MSIRIIDRGQPDKAPVLSNSPVDRNRQQTRSRIGDIMDATEYGAIRGTEYLAYGTGRITGAAVKITTRGTWQLLKGLFGARF